MAGPQLSIPISPEVLAQIGQISTAGKRVDAEIKALKRNIEQTAKAGGQLDQASITRLQQLDQIKQSARQTDQSLNNARRAGSNVQLARSLLISQTAKQIASGQFSAGDLANMIGPQAIQKMMATANRFGMAKLASNLGMLFPAAALGAIAYEAISGAFEAKSANDKFISDMLGKKGRGWISEAEMSLIRRQQEQFYWTDFFTNAREKEGKADLTNRDKIAKAIAAGHILKFEVNRQIYDRVAKEGPLRGMSEDEARVDWFQKHRNDPPWMKILSDDIYQKRQKELGRDLTDEEKEFLIKKFLAEQLEKLEPAEAKRVQDLLLKLSGKDKDKDKIRPIEKKASELWAEQEAVVMGQIVEERIHARHGGPARVSD